MQNTQTTQQTYFHTFKVHVLHLRKTSNVEIIQNISLSLTNILGQDEGIMFKFYHPQQK